MHGNNTMTKVAFARSQAHPRKVELAKILLGDNENKVQDALDSGFNEMIIQEMARDISKNVEGMENFAANLKIVREEEATDENTTVETNDQPIDQTPNNDDSQNQVANESTDPVDPNTTPEDTVSNDESGAPVQNDSVEQSTPDSTTPGQTDPQPNPQA